MTQVFKDMNVLQALEKLEVINEQIESLTRTINDARSRQVGLINDANNLQKSIDETMMELKKNSASGTDWKNSTLERHRIDFPG